LRQPAALGDGVAHVRHVMTELQLKLGLPGRDIRARRPSTRSIGR